MDRDLKGLLICLALIAVIILGVSLFGDGEAHCALQRGLGCVPK